jgi:hypothetical protein
LVNRKIELQNIILTQIKTELPKASKKEIDLMRTRLINSPEEELERLANMFDRFGV